MIGDDGLDVELDSCGSCGGVHRPDDPCRPVGRRPRRARLPRGYRGPPPRDPPPLDDGKLTADECRVGLAGVAAARAEMARRTLIDRAR